MPPIRWLFLAVIALHSSCWIKTISADPDLPVASNGWRPIVGERYESSSQNVPAGTNNNVLATNNQLKTENNNVQFIRNKEQNKNQGNANNFNNNNNIGGHIRINHHGSSGHHTKHTHMVKPVLKPNGPSNVMMSNKMAHPRLPMVTKLHPGVQLMSTNKRHKIKPPVRTQISSHSQRDELIAPAPSSAIGSYAYFNQGPFNIRDTQIGDRNKQFSHHGFSNHYNLQTSNSDLLQHLHPIQYTFGKHPSQNELHSPHFGQYFNQNDEFTRNLVPPPKPVADKEVKDNVEKPTVLLTNVQPFILTKPREEIRHTYPENVVLQLQNPYGFPTGNEPFDLEITREKLKEYHTTPTPIFTKSTEGYSTLTYTTKPRPTTQDFIISHGYEVTEDKNWQENSPFYRVFSSATTPLRQHTYPTVLPDANHEYRHTTQFLPTPIKGVANQHQVFPTSPTQQEVSTIYTELTKINQRFPASFQEETIKTGVHEAVPNYKTPTVDQEEPKLKIQSNANQKDTSKYSAGNIKTQEEFPKYNTQNTIYQEDPSKYIVKEVATHFPIVKKVPQQEDAKYNLKEDAKYNIKEVATHFPIYDVEKTNDGQIPTQNNQINEVTTEKTVEQQEVETTEPPKPTQHTLPMRTIKIPPNRQRVAIRRRRPLRPTTTTENYEADSERSATTERHTTEKPRRRRPVKYRTTQATNDDEMEPTQGTVRRKTSRLPTTTEEEETENYPPEFKKLLKSGYRKSEDGGKYPMSFRRAEDVKMQRHDFGTENYPVNFRKPEFMNPKPDMVYDRAEEKSLEVVTDLYEPQYIKPDEKEFETISNYKNEYATTTEMKTEEPETETTTRRRVHVTTTEIYPVTNLKLPENELEFTTPQPTTQETFTIKEVFQTVREQEVETTTLLTTTAEPTTTKSNRLRRPIKYDSSRPRFSVKDYRQRLSQVTSTTTETNKIIDNRPGKLKYPSRFTKTDDDEKVFQRKFKPTDPRHKTTTENEQEVSTTTEKYKSNRLKPLIRSRTTGAPISSTTAAPKVLIKPNILNNLKRPPHLSLRTRIHNKNKNVTTTTESNNVMPEEEITTEKEIVETTTETIRQTTEIMLTEPMTAESSEEINEDAEAFLQLQRISELTSSNKNNFKTISSTSRRVPSYFTISTDDPILPIEAFFPKLTHRNNEQ